MKKYHLLLLSTLFGLLMVASWPSRGFSFLALIAWLPLLFIDQHIRENRSHFRQIAIFYYVLPGFLIWNALTTYWLYNSTPAGSFMAIGLNSLFMSLVFTIFHIAARKLYSRYQGFLLLIMLWISFEYLHLHWDISWPWLNLGNVFSSSPWAVQWYEYTGIFGGSFYILLSNILLFLAVKNWMDSGKLNRSVVVNLILLILLNGGLLSYSAITYANYEDTGESHEVVIVQPNLDPYKEQYSIPPQEVVSNILNLADKKLTPKTKMIIAPESAIQEYIWEERLNQAPGLRTIKQYILNHPGISMVIGASTFSRIKDTINLPLSARRHQAGFYYNAHNTAIMLDTTDRKQIYHKSKLVAGVEQMPFKKVLDFLPVEQLAIDLGGTIGTLGKSKERKVFYTSDSTIKAAPVICYESVYGDFTGDYILNGANVIFIITNDGWWGNTAGHKQHLDFATLRAIETRKYIARSANTGISAFINQRGDIIKPTQYWEKDVLRGQIITNDIKTFYTKNDDYIARISVFGSVLLLLISIVMSITRKGF
ncbi:MAG: apolipoprotein N-acyltransferase [Bacteroidales bacterium]|nr:apolipoprotein N-acyltransferase [Bacteroidales bacterium]